MDQRSICVFLAMKELSAQAVHEELVAVLGPDAVAYSTVTKYLRQRQFPRIYSKTLETAPETIIDDAILDALDRQPFSSLLFSSIRELAKLTCISTTTVHQHLTQSLGFVMKHLHWVPHALTEIQKAQRVVLSKQLLRELRSVKHQGSQFIITLDESWFYLATDHEQIWL